MAHNRVCWNRWAPVMGLLLGTLGTGCMSGGAAPKPLFGSDGALTNANTVPGGPPTPLFRTKTPSPEPEPHILPAHKAALVDPSTLPRELNKVTMPPYMVEAPDILLINAQRLIPLPPYRLRPLDSIYITPKVQNQFTDPITGIYQVDADGTINLPPNLGGVVKLVDMTVQDAEKLIQERLAVNFANKKEAEVSVVLAQASGMQPIAGEHLVRPDGTIHLGTYGDVYVSGMTLPQVKQTVESHLSKYLYKPEVSVDISAYNSKFYYVITDFAGNGEQVVRVPSTGNENVLDAIAIVGGLSPVSSKRVWIARPAPSGSGDQILPVD